MSPEELGVYKRDWRRNQYAAEKEAQRQDDISQKRTAAISMRHEGDKRKKLSKDNKVFKNSLKNFQALLPCLRARMAGKAARSLVTSAALK